MNYGITATHRVPPAIISSNVREGRFETANVHVFGRGFTYLVFVDFRPHCGADIVAKLQQSQDCMQSDKPVCPYEKYL